MDCLPVAGPMRMSFPILRSLSPPPTTQSALNRNISVATRRPVFENCYQFKFLIRIVAQVNAIKLLYWLTASTMLFKEPATATSLLSPLA
jgi:hypothetical protein